ncbi:MAG TPA: hypothetical protein VH575_16020 [Gemmataceae bacterium]|jgi:hypothetical protein
MRFVSLLFAFVVLGVLAGCGGNGAGGTVELTPEQERQLKEHEKKVANEEQQHQVKQRANRPLTPEQQTEMEERARQRR